MGVGVALSDFRVPPRLGVSGTTSSGMSSIILFMFVSITMFSQKLDWKKLLEHKL